VKHDVRLRPLLPSGEPQLFARVLEDVARDVVLRAISGSDPVEYPALLDYAEEYVPPAPPPAPTGLTLDKPYLALRASLSGDAVVFLPREGICDGIVLDTPYIGLRAGVSGDAVVFLLSDQQLTPAGNLILDKPYIALRAAVDGDALVYLVNGQTCGEPYNPEICEGCVICCTLDGTVEIGDGTGWEAAVDVTLTCGGQVPFTTCYSCTLDETPEESIQVNYENYWRGKTTLAVPFDEGGAGSGTYDYYSEVWSSPTFIIDGITYQLHFFAAQVDRHRVLPTPSESTACGSGAVLKRYNEYEDSPGLNQWQTVIGSGPDTLVVMGFSGTDLFELELNPTYDPGPCPPGYSEAGGDCVDEEVCTIEPPGYTVSSSGSSALCDEEDGTYYIIEKTFIGGGPTINCARFSIADNCEL